MTETDGIDLTPPRPAAGRRLRRRVVTVAVALGAAAGVAVGATALAAAASSPSTTAPGTTNPSTTGPANGSTTPGKGPGGLRGFGGHFRGGFGPGGLGAFAGGGGGPVVHGQYTVKGPNGYETIDERTGTVSAVSDTSGTTWSLTVKSADGTSGTFTVNSSSSVNGGEAGISSVKKGDTVVVTATVSGATATATRITDQTTLQADGKGWLPMHASAPAGGAPGPVSGTATT